VVNRDGPGLIGLMARSAVISSVPACGGIDSGINASVRHSHQIAIFSCTS
jgi:hypothetical protein